VPYDPLEPVVSLNFTLGNASSSSFGTLNSDEVIVDHDLGGSAQGGDLFEIQEQFIQNGVRTVNASIGFGNNDLVQRAPFTSTAPPGSLSLGKFSMGGSIDVEFLPLGGQETDVTGTITSLSEVPALSAPEPNPLLIFAGLAAAFSANRAVSRKRRQP
jgi:hypothetical protein